SVDQPEHHEIRAIVRLFAYALLNFGTGGEKSSSSSSKITSKAGDPSLAPRTREIQVDRYPALWHDRDRLSGRRRMRFAEVRIEPLISQCGRTRLIFLKSLFHHVAQWARIGFPFELDQSTGNLGVNVIRRQC